MRNERNQQEETQIARQSVVEGLKVLNDFGTFYEIAESLGHLELLTDSPKNSAQILYCQAVCFMQTNNIRAAISKSETGFQIANRLEEFELMAKLKNIQGSAYFNDRLFENAADSFEEAYNSYEKSIFQIRSERNIAQPQVVNILTEIDALRVETWTYKTLSELVCDLAGKKIPIATGLLAKAKTELTLAQEYLESTNPNSNRTEKYHCASILAIIDSILTTSTGEQILQNLDKAMDYSAGTKLWNERHKRIAISVYAQHISSGGIKRVYGQKKSYRLLKRCISSIKITTPSNPKELKMLLETGYPE